jgi:hypothetical protein
MRRNKLIVGAAVALTFAGVSLAGVGSADPTDPSDFLYDVRTNGRIAGPDAQLVALGNQVCAASVQGVSAAQTVNAIYSSTQLRSPADAQFIYDSAQMFLCS